MNIIRISNYKEIKDIVEKFNYETDSNILFRGEPKSLVPSIVDKCSFNSYADLFIPNSAIEKKEYFSILISNCVAVEKNKR